MVTHFKYIMTISVLDNLNISQKERLRRLGVLIDYYMLNGKNRNIILVSSEDYELACCIDMQSILKQIGIT